MMHRIALVFLCCALLGLTACKPSESEGDGQNSGQNTHSETRQNAVQKLNPQASQNLLKENSDIAILDVRTPEEYADGHLDKAQNLNFYENFSEQIQGLDKDKPYLVYCAVGGRSAKAADAMKAAGFTQVYDMTGGYKQWHGENLPVKK